MKPAAINTIRVPRFLSFIELAYLLEAAKAADEHLAAKMPDSSTDEGQSVIFNLNATRQSLLRAVFIASYGIVEQNLDGLVEMEQAKVGVALLPSDLKDRGISRSLTYANKVLGKNIDKGASHWKNLLVIQDLRNHLVHYGPDFSSKDHGERLRKFANCDYVTLLPTISFTVAQIERLFDLYMTCVDDFSN